MVGGDIHCPLYNIAIKALPEYLNTLTSRRIGRDQMKFDLYLVLLMFAIGIFYKRLSWKGWFSVTLLVFTWIIWNWQRG